MEYVLRVEPAHAAAVLRIADIPVEPLSPLRPWLEAVDREPSADELQRAGLVIASPEGTAKRINTTVSFALFTAAVPQRILHLSTASERGETEVAVASVAEHRVGVALRDGAIELRFPLGRGDLVTAMRSALDGDSPPSTPMDLTVTPIGSFLIGLLARHGHKGMLTAAEISRLADDEIVVRRYGLALGLVDSDSLDAVYGHPDVVEAELAALVIAGAVRAERARIGLDPQLAALLASPPRRVIQATRTEVAPGRRDAVIAMWLGPGILMMHNLIGQRGPHVRLTTVGSTQVANSMAALLFDDEELRAFATT